MPAAREILARPTLVALALLLWARPARADEPRLRLEVGRHLAPITALATDESGALLASAAQDNTVRLWSLRTGALLQTLRLPAAIDLSTTTQGDRGERAGQLALSADGQTVLVQPPNASLPSSGAAVIDRRSGQVSAPPSGPPPLLVASSLRSGWDAHPLPVQRWQDGQAVWRAEPPPFTVHLSDDVVYGVDRDPRGRVVRATARAICLYDPALRHLAHVPLEPDLVPGAARFSPDGALVAIGYQGRARIDIRAGADLRLLYQADVSDVHAGDLRHVTFSSDGQVLYAAGSRRVADEFPIRRFESAGRGPGRDLPIMAPAEITALRSVPGGGVVFGTAAPSWTALTDAGAPLARGPLPPRLGGPVTVDATGERVSLPLRDHRVSFFVPDRSITPTLAPMVTATDPPGLRPPRQTHPDVLVADWQDRRHVRLNDHVESLDAPARSLVLSHDGKRVFLGLDIGVLIYSQLTDAQGSYWSPIYLLGLGSARALNLAAEGRRLLAALGDGTLRWFATEPLPSDPPVELLALYLDPDGRRWVLFTPSGYYDAAAGAEDLLGWDVDRGPTRVQDHVPMSRLRERYYRPDVIDRALSAGREWRALAAANDAASAAANGAVNGAAARGGAPQPAAAQLLPVVQILSPADDALIPTEQAELRLSVRTPADAPLERLRVLLDGRPLLVEVEPRRAGEALLVTVPTPRSLTVSVQGQSRHGLGPAATVHLRRPGVESVSVLPKLYVLAVGVGRYPQADLRLRYPAKDARDLAQALRRQQGRLYRGVESRVLIDQRATRRGILDGLEWLRASTTGNDVAVLFMAGHGLDAPGSGQYFFLPHDGDPASPVSTAVPDVMIREVLASTAGKVILFLDTCHAGRVLSGVALRGGGPLSRFVHELTSAENGVVVFAASTGRQPSQESAAWGNGAFTHALLEGLLGRADAGRTGRVTLTMLDLYISERVKQLTRGAQIPTTAKPSTIPDFPLAVTGLTDARR